MLLGAVLLGAEAGATGDASGVAGVGGGGGLVNTGATSISVAGGGNAEAYKLPHALNRGAVKLPSGVAVRLRFGFAKVLLSRPGFDDLRALGFGERITV